jgi:hypothetical protein
MLMHGEKQPNEPSLIVQASRIGRRAFEVAKSGSALPGPKFYNAEATAGSELHAWVP